MAAAFRWMTGLLAAALALVSVAVATPAPAPPALVGAVQVGPRWTLRPLDPRTLKPVRGSWSRPVGRSDSLVRSPLGTGVLAAGGRPIVVDARTGRVVRRYAVGVSGVMAYWLGGELPLSRKDGPLLAAESDVTCWSHGCGIEYEGIGAGASEGWEAETVALLRRRIVIGAGAEFLATLEPPRLSSGPFGAREIPLPGLPRSSPMRVVADVAADRLYAISSGGVIAEVDGASDRASVTYHRVDLNGQPFQAIWAGRGRIALWGADGLGTIDTRTWTTKAVAPAATGAIATPYGIATWVGESPGGLSVYRPNGTLRFSVLTGKVVRSAETAGSYLYVRAGHRYAIDLTNGRVLGRVPDSVRLALPSFVPLP
jgi:hypothetical protein